MAEADTMLKAGSLKGYGLYKGSLGALEGFYSFARYGNPVTGISECARLKGTK